MSATVIVSKPSSARALSPAAAAQFSCCGPITYPVIMLNGFYHQPLPRGLSWSDYPRIDPWHEPSTYKLRSTASHVGEPMLLSAAPDGTLAPVRDRWAYEQSIRAADVLVAAVDPSPSEVWAVEVLRRKFRNKDQPFLCAPLASYDFLSLQKALAQAGGAAQGWRPQSIPSWYTHLASQGQVRAYFDHQFALNSLTVLGGTLRTVLGRDPWVSKYQIQALYAIARAPQSLSDLLRTFQFWTGTGKYKLEDIDASVDAVGSDRSAPAGWMVAATALGSPASRVAIIEQLMGHGWIDKGTDQLVRLTDVGREALRLLHPGCCDLDLPFRIAQWAAAGLDSSRPAIDRYIRTFFGRQMRYRP